MTTPPAAGDTHDDPLRDVILDVLVDANVWPGNLGDSQVQRLVNDLVAVLRPHIDAEKRRLRDALTAIATICQHHTEHGEWNGWLDEIRDIINSENIEAAAGGGRPPTDPAGDKT
jgi:hypothetical protein